MANEVWKYFEDNPLTHSAAHYLMTVKDLLEDQGYARITDIARKLKITRGSCSISMKALKKRGFVIEDENKFLHLSDEGNRLAEIVERNDELLESFFHEILGVSLEQAKIDACKVEHLLSPETTMKLAGFIEYMTSGCNTVQHFLKELQKNEICCTHNIENCNICHEVCFFEENSEGSRKTVE